MQQGLCPMCGGPMIIETSGKTLYPDFCRNCADRIMGHINKRDPKILEKAKRKIRGK